MIKNTFKKIFDIKNEEIKTALLMQGYIFLVIATLLVIKPTINSLFISDLGADSLPVGYLLIAISAIITSFFYSKATERFSLKRIIKFTLTFSIISLILLGLLLHFQLIKGWVLYVFYAGVAIYAVLITSQFWVLANLVFNVREAKRLFGFIGAGAITGGIFGGYLTTILAPYIGNANLIFIAALFLVCCFPILSILWKEKVERLNTFKQKKRIAPSQERSFKLIRSSKHLSYLSIIIGIGVITARLVDFQFSDIASKKITDSEELTSFFGFWLSTFNLISLLIQLFLTRKIVGVWGVGFSLLLLPLFVLLGALLFLVFPELWVVILLKATDGSLKQSVNKSAMELLALPLPYTLKKKTKSFIDVVVDSIATGIAGCILIFLIKGLDVPEHYIMLLILLLTLVWVYFVFKVRKEYFLSFRKNLENLLPISQKRIKKATKDSFLKGMKNVFENGTEKEILFMLGKTKELNDKRFAETVRKLLSHPSNSVKAEALRNLYYLNNDNSIILEIQDMLKIENDEVVLAALEYILLHADLNESIVFDTYLNHPNEYISRAALLSLAKETRDNPSLQYKYEFSTHIKDKISKIKSLQDDEIKEKEEIELIKVIGHADFKEGYSYILDGLTSPYFVVKKNAILAAGNTMSPVFVDNLLELLEDKSYREDVKLALLHYDKAMVEVLHHKALHNQHSLSIRRFIPQVISVFKNQESVNALLDIFKTVEDLTIRLECVRALSALKVETSDLYFDKNKIATLILEECKLYNYTLYAMHTQIIIQYMKRKKFKKQFFDAEMDARESLMELLERRLDAGLERIFKLLELQYTPKDVQIAYKGILSEEQEKRTNAIEFLDILLNQNLKNTLIPIIEATILDTSSEEVIEMISKNKFTEYQCFETILKGKDLRLKLAVLYLIEQKGEHKYLPLITPFMQNEDKKIEDFAKKAYNNIMTKNTSKE
ncbi:Npt1/Npt2 family nucleotide transporter [Aquimarina muelleri]|uniref:ADP,ATP carrier protein n=1 Tax=Aquimarina muelleri TaxID=279356 RepID=A0A918N4K4_9FLAO|nr:Npt1/Npt2 family nucleotide transporter [Aquimarina muelleri]MCX2763660.1 MFS transporter [Aquimarina muelleri]GGX30124.1 hypothetical protein GCM10007384_34030 [Aquimarina muelleri]